MTADEPNPAAMADSSLDLDVQLATDEAAVPAGADFDGWVRAALRGAGRPETGGLAIRLIGSADSAALNERFRHKQGPTNVLAFPPPPVPAAASTELQGELGDLVICLPLVESEARAQSKTPHAHLAHLVVHGALHLLGYTHDRDDDAARMERLETQVLAGLGIPDPYEAD